MQVFAIFKFRILLSEEPREHLPRFHANPDHPPALVPLLLVITILVMKTLQPNLSENSYKQLVHVVVNPN